MRNLYVTTSLSFHHNELQDAKRVCVDADTEDVYIATSKSLWKLNARTRVLDLCVDIPHTSCSVPCDKPDSVISLSYLSEQQEACLTTALGDLCLYNSVRGELTCIGTVESGLQAAEWSPDGDIFVLVTGEQRLVFMTRSFVPVHEVPIFSEEFGESKPVTVGWGKKETQFQGSKGKTLAVVREDAYYSIPSWDDRKPRISWRGDGQLFCVCAVDPALDIRKIRVFSRDGILHATSEEIVGLEPEIAWRPSGSVIAAVQRLPNVYQVSFFEKNGLRHREFALPPDSSDAVVRKLVWNSDSTLLAVWLDFFFPEKSSKVLIWTVGNYHWYLKQVLLMPVGKSLRNVLWDSSFPLMLHFFTSNDYLKYNYAWMVNHSQQTSSKDKAAAAVIDGAKLLITPFRDVLIPPPMCAYELVLPCPVNQVVFSSADSPVNLAAVLADRTVAFYEEVSMPSCTEPRLDDSTKTLTGGNSFNPVFGGHILKSVYRLKWTGNPASKADVPLYLHHWLWLKRNLMFAAYTSGNGSYICKISVNDELHELLVCSEKYIKGLVGQICTTSDGEDLLLQLEDGKLLKYSLKSDTILSYMDKLGTEVNFPLFCTSMRCISVSGKEVVFGLTEQYRLFCNNLQLISNATSFAVENNFLLITTLDHTLRCFPLHAVNDMLIKKCGNEVVRNVERGSRIILVVPVDTKVILQMPRGNLETIHPRALVLSIVGHHLDSLNFYEAFILMRKHRINMNLVHDHNPQLFLEEVDKFVSEVNNVNWLNIFLSELQDEDVTTTLYAAAYSGRTESPTVVSTKVNKICKAVKTSLKRDEPKFFLSILTSLVMMKPPELDTALNLIKSYKDQQDRKVSIDESLGYLTNLVDVNHLYQVALGTYDFDLVIMVAQKSQKDPKEYLPFLNELRKMEPEYQKYAIDCHLRKPLKALEHISRCGEKYYDECLGYIRSNNLYTSALKLFPSDSIEYKSICQSYGDYLVEQHCHDEAGLFYHRAGEHHLALVSFEKSLNWEQALATATIIGLAGNHLQNLASRLAARLKDQHQYTAAAYLLEQYVKAHQESIVTLMDGQFWNQALEKIYLHKCEPMIDEKLKPRLLDHYTALLATIQQTSSILERHTSRLLAIREEKSQTNLTENEDLEGLHSDVASDISSITGLTQASGVSKATSRASVRTSKNRRKHERKKQSLKEGSPYEYTALLDALTEIYISVDKMREECSSILKMLVYFGYDNEAQKLNQDFKHLIELLKTNKKKIWQQFVTSSAEPVTGPDSTASSIALSMLQQTSFSNTHDMTLLVPPKTRLDQHWQLAFLV